MDQVKRLLDSKLAWIMIGAILLRIPAMFQSYWYDEAYTAYLSSLPVGDMLADTLTDVHGPLWYMIEIGARRVLGPSEAALRFPAFVLGVLAVWLTYRLAFDLFGGRVAVLAGALEAANPFAVYYSNEARMYSLLLVGVLCASVGAVERRAWLLALGAWITVMAHNIGIVYLPVIVVLIVLYWWKCILRDGSIGTYFQHAEPFLAMGAGLLPWVGWLPFLVQQATTGQFGSTYWIGVFTESYPARLLGEIAQIWAPFFIFPEIQRVGSLVAFALILFPAASALRARNRNALIMLAAVVIPWCGELAASWLLQPVILARTLIGTLPAWCILIAWWLDGVRVWNRARVALMGLAGVVVASSLFVLPYNVRSPNMIKLIDYLSSHADQNDVVCHTSASTSVWFDMYYPGNSHELTGDDVIPLCDWLLDERSLVMVNERIALADRTIAERRAVNHLTVLKTPVAESTLYQLPR